MNDTGHMKIKYSSTLSYYEQHAETLAQRYERADVSDLHRRLLETFNPGAKLLEVGCGSGREAAFLLSHGFEVEGIDPSHAMIDSAFSFHPELEGRLFQGSMPDELPAPIVQDKHYNGIYAIASLMHLSKEQLLPTFQILYRMLHQNGRFLFSVPLSRPDLAENGYDEKGRYFLLLSQAEWITRVESAGFHTVNTSTNGDGMGREAIIWLTCVLEK